MTSGPTSVSLLPHHQLPFYNFRDLLTLRLLTAIQPSGRRKDDKDDSGLSTPTVMISGHFHILLLAFCWSVLSHVAKPSIKSLGNIFFIPGRPCAQLKIRYSIIKDVREPR